MHIISFLQVGNPEGQFSYTQTGTSQNPNNSSGGDALASLLVGCPQGGNGYGVDVAVTTRNSPTPGISRTTGGRPTGTLSTSACDTN